MVVAQVSAEEYAVVCQAFGQNTIVRLTQRQSSWRHLCRQEWRGRLCAKETSTFDNGDAKVLLAAALGKDVKELKDVGFATPRQADAVCDAKDECSAK